MPAPADPHQTSHTLKDKQAFVIGGGIAGLLSAHMLKDRVAKVTLLERSEYAEPMGDTPPARPEVPQSHCLHMLMGAGALAFDALVPGWRDALLWRGAISYDAGADVALRVASGWLPRVKTGITLYGASRCLIEMALLDLLRDAGNVEIRTGQRVVGIELGPDRTHVCGLKVEAPEGRSKVSTDLVIEAGGVASRLPRWLAQHHGTAHQIARTEVSPGRQYVSRWVRIPARHAPNWQGLALAATRQSGGRAGMMMQAENDLWGVVLQAPENVPLPTDDRGFLTLAAELHDTALHDVLSHANPASPLHLYGRTANRRRHYEDYPFWPSNLYAVGDSVCALDPYAGLGMTSAARGIQLLSRYLDEKENHTQSANSSFQSLLAEHNQWPWRIATGDWSNATRPRLREQVESLVQAAPFDPSLARMLLEMQHMLRAPETLTKEAVA